MIEYISDYLSEVIQIAEKIDCASIIGAVQLLHDLKYRNGRLFILGNGGSAANASHAVNDFRKIAGIEAYAPTDNVAELTAWANDENWACTHRMYLQESRLSGSDALLILSVGGGSLLTSQNLCSAMAYAKDMGAAILSIVSRNGGVAIELSNICILVPVVCSERVTPHAEEWQSIICHLLVNALVEEERP